MAARLRMAARLGMDDGSSHQRGWQLIGGARMAARLSVDDGAARLREGGRSPRRG